MSPPLESICAIELPSGDEVQVLRRRLGGGESPRVALVAGVRGDTPEGTRILHAVSRHLAPLEGRLRGTVDLFPCLNPMAAHHGARTWPGFDLDLDRRFPGRADGHAPDRVAHALLAAVEGATQVIDLRGAHPAFRQVPQARVRDGHAEALERAVVCNARVVWRREESPAGSLAEAIPGLVTLEGGVGNRLTEGVGLELSDGVMNLLAVLGILPEEDLPFHWAAIQRPLVVTDAEVCAVRTERGGLFLPSAPVWAEVAEGDALGDVVDPLSGDARASIAAPRAGRVVALREQPVVYPGNLVVRLAAT